jgi:hypothetical protein
MPYNVLWITVYRKSERTVRFSELCRSVHSAQHIREMCHTTEGAPHHKSSLNQVISHD